MFRYCFIPACNSEYEKNYCMIKDFSFVNFVALLCWLHPLTLVVHLAEEYFGGVMLADSPQTMKGVGLTRARFLALTGLGVALVIIGIILARLFGFTQLLLVILGTFILINGTSHAITSWLKAEYNPGVATGLLLWIPLGAVTLVYLKSSMSWQRFLTGIVIGIAIHAIVSLMARGKRQHESGSAKQT